MKKLLLIAILATTFLGSAQYNPEVFGPLYTGNTYYNGVKDLSFSATLDDQLFFSLRRDDNTTDVYATDGTLGNTLLLMNLALPQNVVFTAFDNHVYFGIRVPNMGLQMWKTDGSVAGIVLVAEFGGDGYLGNYTAIGNKLFFAADNSSTVFDDTQPYVLVAGSSTPLLLNPNLFNITDFTEYNGKLYFTASDIENQNSNRELYTSDGTVAGTVMVKDINPGTAGSNPTGLIEFQNKLFFGANNGTNGKEIWSTDGTLAGTQLFKDIAPGINDAFPTFKSGVHVDKLYFAAYGAQLWSTDGTPNGTGLVKVINPAGIFQLSGFVSVNNRLLMAADDGVHGTEIWVSDGTPDNTTLLLDIRPGLAFGVYDIYKKNVFCGSQLFFAGADGSGLNPWVTDGTVAGTYIVEDLETANNGDSVYSSDGGFVLLNDKIFFVGQDTFGNQLYSMDLDCSLGVAKNNMTQVKVYPNPATGIINFDSARQIDNIGIYNTLGKKVMQIDGDKKQVDISQLSTGLYFVKITDAAQQVSTQKIIKR